RIVDHEHDQVLMAVLVEIHNRSSHALIFPGEPIWDIDPGGPTSCHIPLGIKSATETVNAAVLTARIIHGDDQEIRLTRPGHICDRDTPSLIVDREPVWNLNVTFRHRSNLLWQRVCRVSSLGLNSRVHPSRSAPRRHVLPAVRNHACLACCSRVAILKSPFLFTSFGCGLNFRYSRRNEWLSFNIRPRKTSPTRRPPIGPRWIGVSFFLNCCCASA